MAKSARTLSEYASKRLLADYGIPVTHDRLVADAAAAAVAAQELGYPVALKLCGDRIAFAIVADVTGWYTSASAPTRTAAIACERAQKSPRG